MVLKQVKAFYEKAVYVWRVSRQPSNQELIENFKVVMAGLLLMGFIGFFISIIFGLIQAR